MIAIVPVDSQRFPFVGKRGLYNVFVYDDESIRLSSRFTGFNNTEKYSLKSDRSSLTDVSICSQKRRGMALTHLGISKAWSRLSAPGAA